MSERILKVKLSDTNQDHSGRDHFDEPRRIVSPLQRLLMATPTDELITFLDRCHVRFNLSRERKGYCIARIYNANNLEYRSVTKYGPKAALTDAIAKFLAAERDDFHELVKAGDEDDNATANK